ncbi:MAG: ABC transporter ATP-binding protein [Bacteroidota bacterium]
MERAITVRDLTKTFAVRQREAGLRASVRSIFKPQVSHVRAVRGISFAVNQGETVAFIGPNGAGKSTTIKMLTGILFPTSGEASVLGFTPWRERERLAFHIGSVFGQKSQLWYHLPPLDTFDLLAKVYELNRKEYVARRDYLIETFDIGEFQRTPVRKLSLGQRMRCEIAASLLHRPQLIFLDEPTIGLDVVARQSIRSLMRQVNEEEGTTVFLTSHDVGDIEGLCRRVIVINHGEPILDESTSSLKRSYLKSKVVDLKLASPVGDEDLPLPGVRVLKAKGYGLKLEVDTREQRIEGVVSFILQRFNVVDMNISDPPLEDIIAAIYREVAPTPVPAPAASPGSGPALAPGLSPGLASGLAAAATRTTSATVTVTGGAGGSGGAGGGSGGSQGKGKHESKDGRGTENSAALRAPTSKHSAPDETPPRDDRDGAP